MPFHDVFHETNSLALDRIRNDQAGFAVAEWQIRQYSDEGINIIAITGSDDKAKGTEFVLKWLKRNYFFSRASDLQLITIDNHRQVVQPIMSCTQGCFPTGSLSEFTIARQGEDARRHTILFCRKRHTD